MSTLTDSLDLARLRLASGEGRKLELTVTIPPFRFGDDTYPVSPVPVPVVVDLSRMAHNGHAMRLRFDATLHGPCMRCLGDAAPVEHIDAREVDQPGGGEDLESPYVSDDVLDVQRWAIDSLTLEMPPQVLCTPDCLGLCPDCGENLNLAGPEHVHEKAPDPRWAKLSELKLE